MKSRLFLLLSFMRIAPLLAFYLCIVLGKSSSFVVIKSKSLIYIFTKQSFVFSPTQ